MTLLSAKMNHRTHLQVLLVPLKIFGVNLSKNVCRSPVHVSRLGSARSSKLSRSSSNYWTAKFATHSCVSKTRDFVAPPHTSQTLIPRFLSILTHLSTMLNSERAYVDLIFRASRKYASWDPEVVVPLTWKNDLADMPYQDRGQGRRLGHNNTREAGPHILAQGRHILEGGQYLCGWKSGKIQDPRAY
jgi:hypothetical protein